MREFFLYPGMLPVISRKFVLFSAGSFLFMITFLTRHGWAETPDFRSVDWGMSRLEVMAREDNAPISFQAPYIHYQPRIGGREHHLVYGFIEDKLVNAVYIIVTHSPNDYRYFKQLLEKKYGRPERAEDKGGDNYLFTWTEEKTSITIKPGKIRECRIEYSGKKFNKLRVKKERIQREQKTRELFWAY